MDVNEGGTLQGRDTGLSVIIPTYEEEERIATSIESVKQRSASSAPEIIVSDGGSHDRTKELAEKAGADHILEAPERGRASQMNHGAKEARCGVLYFLHSDVWPPLGFDQDIQNAIEAGYRAGTFRFRFRPMRPWALLINSFMTRFSWTFVQGGDRSLFVDRTLFEEIAGYDEAYVVMEDFEILERIRQLTPFHSLPKAVEVSSRKYQKNGYLRVQYANWIAIRLYKRGADPHHILREYKKVLHPNTPGY